MAGSPVCPLSLCRGVSSLHRASLPAGGQGLSEGRLCGEERTRPESGTFCGGECFHSLSQARTVSCLSLHVHSALQPLNYILFGCQSDLFKSQTWLSQNTHPPPPPPSSQLRSFIGFLGSEKNWTGCTGLGNVWPRLLSAAPSHHSTW